MTAISPVSGHCIDGLLTISHRIRPAIRVTLQPVAESKGMDRLSARSAGMNREGVADGFPLHHWVFL